MIAANSAIYNLISWTRARSIVISMFNQTGLFMRSRSQSLWSIFCALLLTDWNKIRVNKWERKKRNGCVTKLVSVGHNNLPFIWPGKWLEELKDIFHRGKKFHSSNLSRFQWMSRKTTTSVGPVEKKNVNLWISYHFCQSPAVPSTSHLSLESFHQLLVQLQKKWEVNLIQTEHLIWSSVRVSSCDSYSQY